MLTLSLGAGVAPAAELPPLRTATGEREPATAGPRGLLGQANELIFAGQKAEACEVLAQAYALTRDPLLQLRIGRLRQQLGQLREARVAYQQFIDDTSAPAQRPHAGLRDEALRALRELPPAPPEPPPVRPPSARPPLAAPSLLALQPLSEPSPAPRLVVRRDRKQMLLGGVLIGAGYLAALGVAIGLSGSVGEPDAPSAAGNYTLLIPVAGPLVSGIVAPLTNENGNARPLVSSWSLPWALTSGLVQVAGLVFFATGATPKPRPVMPPTQPLAPPPAAPDAATTTEVSRAP